MDRFLSNFTNKLDAKGRVSIPAPFRATLAVARFEGLFAHPSLDLPAIDAGGAALLAEIETMLAALPAYSPEREALATALLGVSEMLKIDGEGRVVLTESLKSHAGIADQVVFVGQGSKFQIWEPERFGARLAQSREALRAHRARAAEAAFAP